MRALLILLCLAAVSVGEEPHLRYLPSDTRATLTIHFPNLGEEERAQGLQLFNDLYRTHLAPELGKAARLPLSQISHIVIAMPYAGSFNGLILVRGKVDRPELERQMNQVGKASSDLSIEKMGKPAVPVYTRQLNEKALIELVPPLEKVPPRFRKLVAPYEAHLSAADDDTLVVSLSGKKQIERALRNRTATRLRVSNELAGVLKKQNGSDATAGILMEDSLHPGLALIADDTLRETFSQFDHVTLRVVGGKEIQFILDVQGKGADVAPILEKKFTKMLEIIRELLPTLLPDTGKRAVIDKLLRSFRVSRQDTRITLSGKIPEIEWRKMFGPAKRSAE